MPERALILAAGRGSRLQPLTNDRPKCLVPLAGRPLLDWQLEALRQSGVRDVAAVVGWCGDRVHRPGLVRYSNHAWAHTTMVGSLIVAREWLHAAPCVVVYGDVVFGASAVRALDVTSRDIAITYDRAWRALWEERFEHPLDDAESLCVRDGLVREIGGRLRDLGDADGQFMGLLRLTPRGFQQMRGVLDGLPPEIIATLDVTRLLSLLVAADITVGAVPVAGGWCEIDRVEDLRCYEARLRAATPWAHDWRAGVR